MPKRASQHVPMSDMTDSVSMMLQEDTEYIPSEDTQLRQSLIESGYPQEMPAYEVENCCMRRKPRLVTTVKGSEVA